MQTIFIDSNIFLQCRSLRELPWQEIAGEHDLLIVIPREVQREIDRLKYDRSNRISKRAKRAASLFREMIESPGTIKVIKEGNPRVELTFAPLGKIDNVSNDLLDIEKGDDRIIAEVLNYRLKNGDESTAILTNDTGLILTALNCKLPHIEIPEGWFLPPEPDDKDSKIESLEQMIRELKKSSPELSIKVKSNEGSIISEAIISIIEYSQISEKELDNIIGILKERKPIQEIKVPEGYYFEQLMGLGASHEYALPTDTEKEQYRRDYDKWLVECRHFLKTIKEDLEEKSRYFKLTILLANDGSVPAENVKVEISALGGILLEATDDSVGDRIKEHIEIPSPPKPPAIKRKLSPATMVMAQSALAAQREEGCLQSSLNISKRPTKHDRNAFYWENGKPIEKKDIWTFRCDEFQHKDKGINFDIVIYVPKGIEQKCAIECKINGKNIPKPFYVVIPVIINQEQKDVTHSIHEIIDEFK